MFKSSNVAKLFRNKFADFYQFPRNVEETENAVEMERLKLEDESRTWEEESGVLEMSQNFSDVLGLSCEREHYDHKYVQSSLGQLWFQPIKLAALSKSRTVEMK